MLTQSATPRTSFARAVRVHSQDSRVRASACTGLQAARFCLPTPPSIESWRRIVQVLEHQLRSSARQTASGPGLLGELAQHWTFKLGRRWTGQREALEEQAASLLGWQ